jgi:hypothetical protein
LAIFLAKWGQCAGLVKPDPSVELLWQQRVGVMRRKFGLWAVDHANEALEALLGKASAQTFVPPQVEQETGTPLS